MTRQYKWAAIVPLIGGMVLAGKRVTGQDPQALLTYKAFADNEKSLRAYLPNVPYEVLDADGDQTAGTDFDFISALCPCAGLSLLGTGDAEKRDAANSWMFKSAEHVLKNLKPKVFWGENAPAMYSQTSANGAAVRARLQAMAEQYGYTMTFYFTSTHLHGVPQKRHRTFYFFWRDDQVPQLRYFKRTPPTFAEYLAQVPPDATQHKDDLDRAYNILRQTRFAKWAQAEYGDAFPEVIRTWLRTKDKHMCTIQDFVLADKARTDKMYAWYVENKDEASIKYMDRIFAKLATGKSVWDDSPSIYLPETMFNALIGRTLDSAHPTEPRALTTRECLHMMAFPDDFELTTKTMNHMCQNVPVCTASDMQHEVLAYLNGELPMLDGKVVFQSNFTEAVELVEGDSKLLTF
jgi:site-specific DNA-cytosine methylase